MAVLQKPATPGKAGLETDLVAAQKPGIVTKTATQSQGVGSKSSSSRANKIDNYKSAQKIAIPQSPATPNRLPNETKLQTTQKQVARAEKAAKSQSEVLKSSPLRVKKADNFKPPQNITDQKPIAVSKTAEKSKRDGPENSPLKVEKVHNFKPAQNITDQKPVAGTKTATKPQPKTTTKAVATTAKGAANHATLTVTDFVAVHNNSFYLYAAHYNDVQQPAVVTIVAIVNRTAADAVRSLVCVYYHGYDDPGTNVSARLILLPDHHYKDFAPAFIHCSLPQSVTLTPLTTVSISVTADKRGNRYDILQRSDTKTLKVLQPQPRKYNFLICFSPLHRNFGDVTQVVANLELAQALGADHAVVYNTSITRQLDSVLRHYVNKGFLEVLGWREVPEPVHYKAQMGAINDCLLRNRQRSDFIVFMDTDEMIVPRVHESWADLLHALQAASASSSDFVGRGKWVVEMTEGFVSRFLKEASVSRPLPIVSQAQDGANFSALFKASSNGSSNLLHPQWPTPSTNWTVSNLTAAAESFEVGAVSFVSSVFLWDKVTNLTQEERRFANGLHLSYLLKQRRTVELWPLRSKTIVNPRAIDVMGIHRVTSFAGESYRTLLVNETVGLLQHYRWYNPKAPSVKDTSVLRFASTLVQRMKGVFKELEV
ncbi:hypothetical protein V1264_015025 [Littorina saxatilis]